MRIAVNTRFLLPNKLEGFGWFTYETMSRITRAHPEHEFIFLFDRPYDKKFIFSDNITPVVIGPQARRPLLYYLWFEHSVRKALKKHNADLFISPDGHMSIKSDLPQLAVIHDLNFEHYPEDLPGWARRYLCKWFPRFAKKADRIVTVSNYSKKDIVETYGVNPDKIDVAHNGAAPHFRPATDEEKTTTLKQLTGGQPYFVYIGALHPRKNVGRLIEAFDQFKKATSSAMKLVIIGEKLLANSQMEKTFSQMAHSSDVIFTGRQTSEEINSILGAAYALTYVSYFEGFGIPIAEAFRCGIPVIAGNKTSLPEVAGDAALLVDPFDVDAIAKAMEELAGNPELHADLTKKSMERAPVFNWDKTAEGLWQSVERLIAEKGLK